MLSIINKLILVIFLACFAMLAIADDCFIDANGTKICTNPRFKSWNFTPASLAKANNLFFGGYNINDLVGYFAHSYQLYSDEYVWDSSSI